MRLISCKVVVKVSYQNETRIANIFTIVFSILGMLPEHTVAAYQLAVEQGADVIECDVQITKVNYVKCHSVRYDFLRIIVISPASSTFCDKIHYMCKMHKSADRSFDLFCDAAVCLLHMDQHMFWYKLWPRKALAGARVLLIFVFMLLV